MLRSLSRPEANSRAVPPLTAMPMASHRGHRAAGHRDRVAEAPDRLPSDLAGDDQQDQRVGERREDRARPEPIGEPAARAAPAEQRRAPRQAEPQHVAEIVPGIGQERERAGRHPVSGLGRDTAERGLRAMPIANARPKSAGAWAWLWEWPWWSWLKQPPTSRISNL